MSEVYKRQLQDGSLAEQERVTHAIDCYGGRAPLSALLPQEHATACEALLLLTTATSKRAPPADVAVLLQLLAHQCAQSAAGAGAAGGIVAPRAHIHAFGAFITLVLPRWSQADAAAAVEDAPLAAILKASDVAQAVAALPAERSGLAAAAQLAFAAATIAHCDRAETQEATSAAQLLGKALNAAALHALVRLLNCEVHCFTAAHL